LKAINEVKIFRNDLNGWYQIYFNNGKSSINTAFISFPSGLPLL
jgi:hypothetical protein